MKLAWVMSRMSRRHDMLCRGNGYLNLAAGLSRKKRRRNDDEKKSTMAWQEPRARIPGLIVLKNNNASTKRVGTSIIRKLIYHGQQFREKTNHQPLAFAVIFPTPWGKCGAQADRTGPNPQMPE